MVWNMKTRNLATVAVLRKLQKYLENEREYDHRFLIYIHSMNIHLSFKTSSNSLQCLELEL